MAIIDQLEKTVEVAPKQEHGSIEFSITNVGDSSFNLRHVTASCGCTDVNFEPKTILPGKTGIVKAKIRTINVGMLQVLIEAFTDIPTQPTLSMRVIVKGTGTVPYISYASQFIGFGNVSEVGVEVPFFIETRENEASVPWLKTPIASLKGVSIKGGMTRESSVGNHIVLRHYEYMAKMIEIPQPGEFRGEVHFPENESGLRQIKLIPMHGNIIPIVQASPGALFGSYAKFDELPTFKVTFRNNSRHEQLKITPSNPDPDYFDIKKIDESEYEEVWQVRLTKKFGELLDTELVFRTNAINMPEVRLPVRIKVRDKGLSN